MPLAAMRRVAIVAASLVLASLASAGGSDPWAPPVGYYDSVTGTGATLKTQLYDRMRTGHTQRSYGDFRQSAAIHDADPSTGGTILLAYNRASVSATWNSGATWNREHVWPQSRQPGDASNSTRGNLGDPHALRPMNPSINSSRGNKPFGLPDTIGTYRSLGTYYFVGDADRGDIARSLMYSDTRWGPERGLALVNGFPSGNQMGDLESLLAWHYLDTPDEFERRRNHTIYSSAHNPSYFTNNRNAYVDLPGAVWSVYVDQANDSRLFVGGGANPDGSSTLVLGADPVFAGETPATTSFTLTRDGNDGVYYRVSPQPGATSPQSGDWNAFAINGPDTAMIEVGFAPGAADDSGLATATVLIDNLDVTTGGGAGRGANDADDVVMIDLMVFDRSEGSFDEFSDVDLYELDLGEIELGNGNASAEVVIFNIGGPGALVADLDVVFDMAVGDDDRFSTDLTGEESVGAFDDLPIIVTLADDVAGVFSADFVYRVFDDRSIDGFDEGAPLTIRVTGEVASACPADLDGDGSVGSNDLAILLSGWGAPGAGDLDGSGEIDAADLATLLAGWGACAG